MLFTEKDIDVGASQGVSNYTADPVASLDQGVGETTAEVGIDTDYQDERARGNNGGCFRRGGHSKSSSSRQIGS
jgi:hypothetical protein